jgi:carboxypeptidase family protein
MNKNVYILQGIVLILVLIFSVIFLINRRSDDNPEAYQTVSNDANSEIVPTPEKKDTVKKISVSEEKKEDESSSELNQINLNIISKDKKFVKNALAELFLEYKILLPVEYSPVISSRTSENGQISMGTDLQGNYVLRVSSEGHSTSLNKIRLADKQSVITKKIILQPGYKISGVLRNKKGDVIRNALIGPLFPEAELVLASIIWPCFTRTDKNGSFYFNGLKESSYTLQVAVKGYKAAFLNQLDAPFEDLEITLESGGTEAGGICSGSREGNAISGVSLILVGGNISLHVISAKDGTFIFSNLSAGKYYIEPVMSDEIIGKPLIFDCDGINPVTDLVLKVNQGIIVEGKLIDSHKKASVPGIKLVLGETRDKKEVFSDEEGKFLFQNLKLGKRIEIRIDSPGYYFQPEGGDRSKVYTVEGYMPDEDISALRITLDREFTVKGFVQNLPEEKFSEYRILVMRDESGGEGKPIWSGIDASGEFSSRIYGTGEYYAVLKDEKGKTSSRPHSFQLSITGDSPYIEIALSEPEILKGIILDHKGNALKDARITADGVLGRMETQSSENGEFSFKIFDNLLNLQVKSDAYSQLLEKAVTLPQDKELILQFSVGKILSGTVLSHDDEAVENAEIKYTSLNSVKGIVAVNTIRSGKEGRFRITDVNADSLDLLSCSYKGKLNGKTLGTFTVKDLSLPREDYIIKLQDSVSLNLSIQDETGEAWSGNLTLDVMFSENENKGYKTEHSIYKKISNGRLLLDSLNPGIYQIKAKTADGKSGNTGKLNLSAFRDSNEAIIILRKMESLYGYVYDSSNNPLENVNVSCSIQESSLPVLSTSSDNEGYFNITGLSDGSITLVFSCTAYQEKTRAILITDGSPDVILPLKISLEAASGIISGMILDKENIPVEDVMVSLRKRGAAGEGSSSYQGCTTGREGKFLFENLDTGNYFISASKEHSFSKKEFTLEKDGENEIILILKKMIHVIGTLKTSQTHLLDQPVILLNTDIQKSYIARISKDRKFECWAPPGNYRLLIGESEVSSELVIADDAEEYFLDLSF